MTAEDRINALIEKYGDMILRLSYTYMKNLPDAEDAAQDVFLKLIELLPEFNGAEHEKAWIIRVTINTCKNKLRFFGIRRSVPIEDIDIPVYDKHDENTEVFAAVMALPEKYRTVIHLYYYEEYSTPEIAHITGRKESSIRSDLHRARARLKDVLKEGYDFE
ncbi:MAG: sigma-70 family RNA polymerase sigma factor [Clostridia bacterium]|nr:sigma-70 family RNA polymerase sigma factor [Clostridia bacterium]